MNWVSIMFLLTGGARFFFLAETNMELEWLFSHSFFVSVHPCCVEGEGVALNVMNEAYDLLMEKSKKSTIRLAIHGIWCIVCPDTGCSTSHKAKESLR